MQIAKKTAIFSLMLLLLFMALPTMASAVEAVETNAVVAKTYKGSPVQGAYFAVAPYSEDTNSFADGSTAMKTLGPTDENGQVSLSEVGLSAGNIYSIYEIAQGTTTDISELSTVFTIQGDGSITPWFEDSGDGVIDGNTIAFTAQELTLHFDWRSADGGMIAEGDQALIEITGKFADGNTKEVALTQQLIDGEEVSGFISGERYVLTQTQAPYGHAKADGSLVFVAAGGSNPRAVIVGDPSDNFSSSFSTVTITNEGLPYEYNPTVIKVCSVDESGNPLPGAAFALEGFFMVGIPETMAQGGMIGQQKKEASADSTGEASFSDLLYKDEIDGKPYEYRLAETKAPEGYDALESTPIIAFDNDKKLTIVGNASPVSVVASKDGSVTQQPDDMPLVSIGQDGMTVIISHKKAGPSKAGETDNADSGGASSSSAVSDKGSKSSSSSASGASSSSDKSSQANSSVKSNAASSASRSTASASTKSTTASTSKSTAKTEDGAGLLSVFALVSLVLGMVGLVVSRSMGKDNLRR